MGAKNHLPRAYREFIRRYPKLSRAWDLTGEAGKEGPLDEKTLRLVKLGISMGALREGAVHANVRKALEAGIPRASIEQTVALVAGTLGFPASVAVFSWVEEVLGRRR
jgi:alkylhydroperoxidase/carboxymuconolactone decarboxylase family protein YurZ